MRPAVLGRVAIYRYLLSEEGYVARFEGLLFLPVLELRELVLADLDGGYRCLIPFRMLDEDELLPVWSDRVKRSLPF